MRLQTNEKDTLTGTKVGTGDTRGFKFDVNNAFFFKSMIDGLYSDKESSVVREIIANAFDAHAMAKNKPAQPVEVNLPTMFSNNFSVRDFGDGMSHDFVMDLYTTLGHSEKTKTNAATGMFGLGAKTPFAVADAFEVRVFTGTEVRIYQCSYAKNGCPELTHVQTLPSTEHSGVKITVPITDRTMQAAFERAINNAALCYFDKNIKFNRPTSSGDNMLDLAKNAVRKIGTNYFVRESTTGNHTSCDTVYVRQGFAVYPCDLRKLKLGNIGFLNDHDILRAEFDQYRTEVMIDCPIGTFEVTPSREALQYTEYSIKNLTDIVGKAIEDARTTLYASAKGAKTIVEFVQNVAKTPLDHPDTWIRGREKFAFFGKHIAENFLKDAKKSKIDVADYASNAYHGANSNGFDEVLETFAKDGKMRAGAHRTISWTSRVKTALGIVNTLTCYDGVTAQQDTACDFDKTTDTSIQPHEYVLFVPNDVRQWEDKVHHFLRTGQKNLDVTKGAINVIVFRGAKTDLALVRAWVEAHNVVAFMLPETKADLLVDPPSAIAARANRVVKPRPANNDAYVLDGTGSWELVKNVDFSQPCYVIIRDRRHGMIQIATQQQVDAFNKLKHGAAAAFDGLTMRTEIAEHSFVSVIRTMRRQKLIDETRPVYSLRRAQADALEKQGVKFEGVADAITGAIGKVVPIVIESLKSRAALNVDWATSATATLRALVRNAPKSAPASALASALVGDLLVTTRLALHGLSSTTYQDDLTSPSSRAFLNTIRLNTSQYDDLILSVTHNYSSLVGAHHGMSISLPNTSKLLYPLMTFGAQGGDSTGEWLADATEYVEAKSTALDADHTKQATDLLNALPASIKAEVIASIKTIRDFTKAAADKFTNKATTPTTVSKVA